MTLDQQAALARYETLRARYWTAEAQRKVLLWMDRQPGRRSFPVHRTDGGRELLPSFLPRIVANSAYAPTLGETVNADDPWPIEEASVHWEEL